MGWSDEELDQLGGYVQSVGNKGAGVLGPSVVDFSGAPQLPYGFTWFPHNQPSRLVTGSVDVNGLKVGLHQSPRQSDGRSLIGFDLLMECMQKPELTFYGAHLLDAWEEDTRLIPESVRAFKGTVYACSVLVGQIGEKCLRGVRFEDGEAMFVTACLENDFSGNIALLKVA